MSTSVAGYAAVEQHINWYREGVYARGIATLETVLQSVRPAGIFQLLAPTALVEDGE